MRHFERHIVPRPRGLIFDLRHADANRRGGAPHEQTRDCRRALDIWRRLLVATSSSPLTRRIPSPRIEARKRAEYAMSHAP